MDDYSYIGVGNILIREYGAAAPFVEVGNCSGLTLSPSEDVKQLKDYTVRGGGVRNEVRRISGVELGYSFHDFSADNFARALRADITTIAAGTATAEALVAYKGGYTPAAKIITAITTVKSADEVTTYVVNTDYELRDGQLYIPSTSTITDPVAGAANLHITYTYAAQKKLQALVNDITEYEVLFIGLNEAQSGKKVRVRCHRVSGGVIKQMALLGEEYGVGELTGALMTDTTKTGDGISQYFTVEMQD